LFNVKVKICINDACVLGALNHDVSVHHSVAIGKRYGIFSPSSQAKLYLSKENMADSRLKSTCQ